MYPRGFSLVLPPFRGGPGYQEYSCSLCNRCSWLPVGVVVQFSCFHKAIYPPFHLGGERLMGSFLCSAASPVFSRGFCMLACLREGSLFIVCCSPGRRCAGTEPLFAAPAAAQGPCLQQGASLGRWAEWASRGAGWPGRGAWRGWTFRLSSNPTMVPSHATLLWWCVRLSGEILQAAVTWGSELLLEKAFNLCKRSELGRLTQLMIPQFLILTRVFNLLAKCCLLAIFSIVCFLSLLNTIFSCFKVLECKANPFSFWKRGRILLNRVGPVYP